MATLKWIAALALLGYAGLLVLMYVAQRSLMYFPDPVRRPPASVGLPQADEVTLDTPDDIIPSGSFVGYSCIGIGVALDAADNRRMPVILAGRLTCGHPFGMHDQPCIRHLGSG